MSKSLNATKNRTTGNRSKSNFIAPLYRDLSRERRGPGYTSASVPPGVRCLRRPKGEEYGRTPYRAEIPVRGRARSRRLLVVPLRGFEEPAVLRRHPQDALGAPLYPCFLAAVQRPSAPPSVRNEPSIVPPLTRPVKSRRTP